jgi:hypothetical protein
MSRRLSPTFLRCLPGALLAALLLTGCDGEPVDYSGERYDIVLTWVDGSFQLNLPAVYGSLGVAAATNQPGSRGGAARWQDAAGDFWLFGGRGYDAGDEVGRLQDLWKYSPASGQWTWMGGAGTIGGTLTNSGAGVYGTQGTAAPGNLPGARNDAVAWTDASHDFWLFGGEGHDSAGTFGRLNDLWKYSTASGQWTWVSGSNLVNQPGVYGTQGTAGAANVPGGRHSATGWVDSAGALWLFGGSGLDTAGACCLMNDLWKFSGGQWTWMTGSTTKDPSPVYGTQNTAAATNTPAGRIGGASWFRVVTVTSTDSTTGDTTTTSTDTVWIYGGEGSTADGLGFISAELWKYTPAGWAWVSGAQSTNVSPVYDSRGAFSLTALPGSRSRPLTWTGSDGSLWLFGGDVASGTSGSVANPNDLWRWKDVAWSWAGGKGFDNPAGNYIALGATGQPGGRAGASGWLGADGKLWIFGGDLDALDTSVEPAALATYRHNDLWYYEPPAAAAP